MQELFSPPGIQVEPSQIEISLNRMWEGEGENRAKACLLNLVAFTENLDLLDKYVNLFNKVQTEFACRAILAIAQRNSQQDQIRAWISANCHIENNFGSEEAHRQICSEQIILHFEGETVDGWENFVFAHLDSDLPLVLLWLEDFPHELNPNLWRYVDRLVFDSSKWTQPGASFFSLGPIINSRLQDLYGCMRRRTHLCDLNWTRLLPYRFAFASLFDSEAAQAEIPSFRYLEIHHSPQHSLAAKLFAGWIALRIQCQPHPDSNWKALVTRSGRELQLVFVEKDGPILSSCELVSESASFRLTKKDKDGHFELCAKGSEILIPDYVQPFFPEEDEEVLLRELARRGYHPLYLQTMDLIRNFI
ncbi:MAG: glucose-6-phosphate dehydrogenase assembly protein OpcA [Chthoniobacterales bacterium]|nr:glucose-6-phosphate dehydrogenase assembly protein OpcA [Chthoniobacterales bacterium]